MLATLNDQVQKDPLALDAKLAEYVFFPLYHIFRQMELYPLRLTENCVKVLQLLITHGWKQKISAQLVQQIFSLLVFIIDGQPGAQNKSREVPEELLLEAYRTQCALLKTASMSATAVSGLTEQDTMPALGHGITVMLDGAADGVSPQIQLEALRALQSVYSALRDHRALASFLPGTISSLAKILSSPNRHKSTVLTKSLEVVQVVLTKVLGDMRTRSILAQADKQDVESFDKEKALSPAWLKATASQVKLALSNMMKLRTHSSADVKNALERLCISLLDECHSSLADCTTILVETAIVVDGREDSSMQAETNLCHLVGIYPELGDTVKAAVYGWMASLSRVMQIGDEDAKRIAVHNLEKGIELLQSLDIESSILEDSMANTLRDSIVSLIQSSKQPNVSTHLQLLGASHSTEVGIREPEFQPVLLAGESQRMLRQEVMGLISRIGSTSLKLNVAASMMDHVRESSSNDQIASLWLCYELVKAASSSNAESDACLDLSAFSGPTDELESIFEDMYSYSVQVLESHADSDTADWRLEAVCLEIAAYAAQRLGTAFRPDLMDVLFPVATFLGSDNPILQQHAVAALNSIAMSCSYSTVSDLIIDNVDYMVNSVSLRLNSLDISPASMQVLLMMIRLSGPRLIPYLNDVVESIFAALENYHGYTLFAENLFSVLKEIAYQASREDQRLLTDRERIAVDHKKINRTAERPNLLNEYLDKREARKAREAAEAATINAAFSDAKGHPKVPWGTKSKTTFDEELGDDQDAPSAEKEEEKPPNSPTYQLLLRIASLTQHYLTSPTPRLRRELLELLTTASSVLAGDEDSFLPLVNSIWPVVVERLRDPEPFISVEACHALGGLCKAAGDFLSTRFNTEWGDWLRDWCRKVKKQAASGSHRPVRSAVPEAGKQIVIPVRSDNGLEIKEMSVVSRDTASGSLGQFASPVKLWEAVVSLLTAIVSYVRIDSSMFDDILDLLADVLERNHEVREALDNVNADAVWLVRYERGHIEHQEPPVVEGWTFTEMLPMP